MAEASAESDTSIQRHPSAKPLLTSAGLVSTDKGCVCLCVCVCSIKQDCFCFGLGEDPRGSQSRSLNPMGFGVRTLPHERLPPQLFHGEIDSDHSMVPALPLPSLFNFPCKSFLSWGLTDQRLTGQSLPVNKFYVTDTEFF